LIISPGAGALLDERNRAALSGMGLTICLTARVDVIAARVRRAREPRPKLMEGGLPLERRIAQLLDERREIYAGADITVDTSDRTVAQVADAVLAAITEAWRGKMTDLHPRIEGGSESSRN
jgi:shikimate kinase